MRSIFLILVNLKLIITWRLPFLAASYLTLLELQRLVLQRQGSVLLLKVADTLAVIFLLLIELIYLGVQLFFHLPFFFIQLPPFPGTDRQVFFFHLPGFGFGLFRLGSLAALLAVVEQEHSEQRKGNGRHQRADDVHHGLELVHSAPPFRYLTHSKYPEFSR